MRHAFESVKEELQIDMNYENMDEATLGINLRMYLTSPRKARRYNQLLQQIRFHEVRACEERSDELRRTRA